MAVDLEFYLAKLEEAAQEEDVEDASHRARVQWYVDLTVRRLQGMSGGEVTIEDRRELISGYMFTSAGRETWATALVGPGLSQYNSFNSLIGTRADPQVLTQIKRSLIEYDNFFSILSEPERFTRVVCKLRAIARDLYDLYKMIDSTAPPGVLGGDDPRKTAGDPGLCERPGDDTLDNGNGHLTSGSEEDDEGASAD